MGSIRMTAPVYGALIMWVPEMAMPTWVMRTGLMLKKTRSPDSSGAPAGRRGLALYWDCAVRGTVIPTAW